MSKKFLFIIFTLFLDCVNYSLGKDTKIVNGENATISDAPYQVSLQYSEKSSANFGSGHFCGGSLIGKGILELKSNKTDVTMSSCNC